MKAQYIIFCGLIAAMLALTGCPEPDPVHTHTWGAWQETKAPTITAEGEETRTCATCGATETKAIAQLEPEKAQHSPNTPMFADKTATITTTDTFTDTQWNAIVTAIVGKFSTAYNSATAQQKEAYEDVLDQGVTITVEKNPQGYTDYKTVSYTLYVRSDGVNNLDAHKVIVAMATGNGTIDGVTPPPCTTCLTTYGTTAHLGIDANGNVVACTCGGTNCSNCTEQTAEAYNVPIRKTANVSVKQMNDTVAIIKSIMGNDGFPNKDMFAELITTIHIVPGNTVNFQNDILTVGSAVESNTLRSALAAIYDAI